MGRGLSEVSYDTLPDIPLNAEGTLGDHLYSVLEESILDGLLPAGSHILPGELSRRYGVSIVPIRESLRALDAHGWVKIRAHQGAFVRTGDPKEVSDLFDSRLVIEPSLAVRAAEKRTTEDMADLNDLVSQGHEIASQEAGAPFARLNSRFHRRVAEAADNSILLGYQTDMNKCVRFYFSKVSQERMLASAREHAEIVEAIGAGDLKATSELSIRHIHNTRILVKASTAHEGVLHN
jgi:DNA-binding GntR family transcriptional regulator